MTTTADEQFRPGFEAWAPSVGHSLARRADGDYQLQVTRRAWQAWIASKRDTSTEPVDWSQIADLMKAYGIEYKPGMASLVLALRETGVSACDALSDKAKDSDCLCRTSEMKASCYGICSIAASSETKE